MQPKIIEAQLEKSFSHQPLPPKKEAADETKESRSEETVSLQETQKAQFLQNQTELAKYIQDILSSLDLLELDRVEKFGLCVKATTELVRENPAVMGMPLIDPIQSRIDAEKQFCKSLTRKILISTQNQVKDIGAQKTTLEQKGALLGRLAYVSGGLIAIVGVQSRFGRRLAFHNLLHTLEMAFYSVRGVPPSHKFVALFSATNHDCLMTYKAATPEKADQAKQDFLEAYRAIFIKAINSSHSRYQLHNIHVFLCSDEKTLAIVKKLKIDSELVRDAGWNSNDSEKRSFDQMETQLTEIVRVIKEAVRTFKLEAGVLVHLERQVQLVQLSQAHVKQEDGKKEEGTAEGRREMALFRERGIQNTIPDKSNCAMKKGGVKLATISNGGFLLPLTDLLYKNQYALPLLPKDRLSEALLGRLIKIMNAAVQNTMAQLRKMDAKPEEKKGVPLTYTQGIEDIHDTREFYRMCLEYQKTEKEAPKVASMAKEELRKQKIAQRKQKGIEEELPYDVPRFKLDYPPNVAAILINSFPTFDDPMVGLHQTNASAKTIQEMQIKSLVQHLQMDQMKHDNQVTEYLKEQLRHLSLPNSDVGDLLRTGAKLKWLKRITLRLADEENRTIARLFFMVHENLVKHASKVQELKKSVVDEKEKDFYADCAKTGFLEETNDKVHQLLRFPKFRQLYGIGDAEYDGYKMYKSICYFYFIDQKLFAEDRMKLVQHHIYEPMKALESFLESDSSDREYIKGFEQDYVDPKTGAVRTDALDDLQEVLKECQTDSGLCSTIMKVMEFTYGSFFLKMPSYFGYSTAEGNVDPLYVKEQEPNKYLELLTDDEVIQV